MLVIAIHRIQLRDRPISALQDTMASLGEPISLLTLGNADAPIATIARWRHGDAVIDVAPDHTVRLAVSLEGGQQVRARDIGERAADSVRVGSVSVYPGREHSRVAVEGSADILQIFIPKDSLEAMLGRRFVCPPLFDTHDQALLATVMQLLVAAMPNRADDRLAQASLARIANRLADHADPTLRRPAGCEAPARGGLSPSARRSVDARIDAALNDPRLSSPTLKQLASAANLSVSHFIRAFRQQTGVTPHRHILRQRIEQAIALLKKQGTSVAEVADDTGFATPAHFVDTFRRAMGVTPGALRTALLA